MPRFAASKGQANQDQGGGNTKQGLPPSIGVRASLARLMSRKAFSNPNPVAVALARIFDNFDFIGGIYDIVIKFSSTISQDESFTRIYFIGAFTLRLKGSSDTLRTNIAVFNVSLPVENGESEYELVDWNPVFTGTGITAITAIAIDNVANHVYLGISTGSGNTANAIQRFNIVTAANETASGFVLANPTNVNTIVLRENDVFVGATNLYVFNKSGGTFKYGTTDTAGILTLAAPDSNANDPRMSPSIRSIAFRGNNRVYIGGHFKIANGNTITHDGAAAYNLDGVTNKPTIITDWNPAIKKNAIAENSNNYINHIKINADNKYELYGKFQLATNDTSHLAITVNNLGQVQSGARTIIGTGIIQRYYESEQLDEYLSGNFSIDGINNIVVRKIDNDSSTNYTTNSENKQIFGVAADFGRTVFVGGLGIKPQKLSVTGGTLS